MEQSNTETEIFISEMAREELPFILRTQNDLGLSSWSFEDYIKELGRDDSISLVAKENNLPKGFIIMRLIMPDNEAEIYNVGVNINVQRRGFGKSLLSEALKICFNKNIKTVWLEVRKSNLKAINFYKNFGFEITGERKEFYTKPVENAYVMKLSFTQYKNKQQRA